MRTPALPILLLVAIVGCDSSVEPTKDVTVLITNGTCGAAGCSPIQLLGFPSNQPLTPGGYWSIDLGLLTGPSACVTLPASAVFRVIGVSNDGTRADTTTFKWTLASGLSLGSQPPSASRIFAAPSTSAFIPVLASGWRATLPGGSAVSRAEQCTP